MPERALFIVCGPIGVGKSTICQHFFNSTQDPDNVVCVYNRDWSQARVPAGSEQALQNEKKALENAGVNNIYEYILELSALTFRREDYKDKNVYVFCEGNWGKDNRLRYVIDRLGSFKNVTVQILHFCMHDFDEQCSRIIKRNNPKDAELLADVANIYKHVRERSEWDEEAFATYEQEFIKLELSTKISRFYSSDLTLAG